MSPVAASRLFTLCVIRYIIGSKQLGLVSFVILWIIRQVKACGVNQHRVGMHWQKFMIRQRSDGCPRSFLAGKQALTEPRWIGRCFTICRVADGAPRAGKLRTERSTPSTH
jgi:hypothetical protein